MDGCSVLEQLPVTALLQGEPIVNENPHSGFNDPLARYVTAGINRPFSPNPRALGVQDAFTRIPNLRDDYDLTPYSWYEQRQTNTFATAELEDPYLYTGWIPVPDTSLQVPTMQELLAQYNT